MNGHPNSHLQQLTRGQYHRRDRVPLHTHRRKRVVRVHDRVDGQVHRGVEDLNAKLILFNAKSIILNARLIAGTYGGRLLVREGVKREEQDRYVVVPVQQDQRTFPNDDEEGIQQLCDLRDGEQRHPENDSAATVVVLPGLADILQLQPQATRWRCRCLCNNPVMVGDCLRTCRRYGREPVQRVRDNSDRSSETEDRTEPIPANQPAADLPSGFVSHINLTCDTFTKRLTPKSSSKCVEMNRETVSSHRRR